ncbi:UNVERIFIED_CONTAM: MBG domain-containing protein, partial [Pseudomonas aeruginosa]
TGSQTGDAGYMGRAIIDVGNGTVWIKTSKSASVIQQEGTALIGKQVAVEGASVLLDSPLNHAGTLAGKATNGKFLYNQTSNGDVNTGTVRIDHGDGTSETMEGVSSSAIAKLGEQWIWERTGDTPDHLTLDETTPFQYLVFEALEYVDHKDHKPIAGDRTDSDYWVSSLTFKNPATGDVWVVSSDPTSTSGISVSRNGEATTEMPPGFALGTDLGSVTASANGWGVTGGTGDQGNPAASNAINRHGAANTSDKLVVDLGSNTSSVDANANELWHSGNKYESGVVSFLGSKDTSEKGGVTLKSQTAQLQGTIADAQREYGEANPAFSASVGVPGDASENSRAVKGVDDFVDRQLNQNRFDVKVSPTTTATVESNVGDYRVDGSVQADGFVGQRYQTTVKPGTLLTAGTASAGKNHYLSPTMAN